MQLPDKAVEEFTEIFKKEYGKKLSPKEGRESAQRLFDFISLLVKVDKKQKKESNGNTRKG